MAGLLGRDCHLEEQSEKKARNISLPIVQPDKAMWDSKQGRLYCDRCQLVSTLPLSRCSPPYDFSKRRGENPSLPFGNTPLRYNSSAYAAAARTFRERSKTENDYRVPERFWELSRLLSV